jgi:uncharacterized iron-regulated membrane protein
LTRNGAGLYRAVWRWHFYAGVFSIPFILWLSVTGSVYLFRPQIERALDRRYDHLAPATEQAVRATPQQIAMAAVAAVPGATLHSFELPPSSQAAVRVLVGVGTRELRVYVNPWTLRTLGIVDEDRRPMNLLAHLHGQLLAGRWGSYVVELAASWAVVLLLTGVYLWWPQQVHSLAGILWVRTGQGSRVFWRDLHAVTGTLVAGSALFLILTGLPWATGWGSYFEQVRVLTHTSSKHRDWTTGRASEIAARVALNSSTLSPMADMPDMDHGMHTIERLAPAESYAAFDRVVPAAAALGLAAPVEVMPPKHPGGLWTAKSNAQNRTLRDTVELDPHTGAVVSREDFYQRPVLDRMVAYGIAAHEGQLFGPLNQLLGVLTAAGLIVLSLSAVQLWWRRRLHGVLGAPAALPRPRMGLALGCAVFCLAVYLPAMGLSLALVLALERLVLRRVPAAQRWLGLPEREAA